MRSADIAPVPPGAAAPPLIAAAPACVHATSSGASAGHRAYMHRPLILPPDLMRRLLTPQSAGKHHFASYPSYDRAFSLFGKARVGHKVARFRQTNMEDPNVHHDALEFPGSQVVLLTRLTPGQRATVLQMPATGHTHDHPIAETTGLTRPELIGR
jgi:hypothetical protein